MNFNDPTYWKTEFNPNANVRIYMDFKDKVTINGFRTRVSDNVLGSAFKDFNFAWSINGNHNWTTITSGTRHKDCCFWVTTLFQEVSAAYFGFQFSSNWGGDCLTIQELQFSFGECLMK